jgi:MFS family permease
MAIANFLLAMTVYMLVPTMPKWLIETQQMGMVDAGIAMGAFGVGLFALGAFISYLVQHYRRNLVCIYAVLAEALLIGVLYYIDGLHMRLDDPMVIIVHRLAQGAAFGLAQMVLTSTLIIDTSESFQRTEANHSAAWFGRLGLALGPIVTILVSPRFGVETVLLVSSACGLLAMLLVILTDFPFRAPEDNLKAFSTDRFFLTNGIWLFVNFMMIMIAVGIVVVNHQDMRFFVLMLGGFLISLLSQKFVFANAELKSEILSALVLIIGALLLMIFRDSDVASLAAALLTGVGVGVSATRFLLFFIKLSPHCKRGTSQSTFFLTWQSGLALGAALGIVTGQSGSGYVVALAFVVAALIMYHFFTHTWYMNNKSR